MWIVGCIYGCRRGSDYVLRMVAKFTYPISVPSGTNRCLSMKNEKSCLYLSRKKGCWVTMANSANPSSSICGSSSLLSSRRRTTRNTRIAGVTPISRLPILLSFVTTVPGSNTNSNHNDPTTSNVIIQIGHVGQSRFKHIVEVLPRKMTTSCNLVVPKTNATNLDTKNPDEMQNCVTVDATTAETYYRIYADTIEHVFHLLGQDSKERRVIILHDFGLYVQRTWKTAITRILQDIIGTQAVSFHPALSMIPFAFSPTPKNNAMLIIFVTLNEAHCIVFADNMVLEYTYQTCGYPKAALDTIREKMSSSEYNVLSVADLRQMQSTWITSNIHENLQNPTTSLIIAILKTLEACPRQLRLAAIHNLVFAGSIIDSSFGLQVAKRLEEMLKLYPENNVEKTKQESTPPTREKGDGDAIAPDSASSDTSKNNTWTYRPFNFKALSPLVDHIAVVQFFQHQIRPDLLSWLGASVWAKHWHEQDPDSTQLKWQSLVTTVVPSSPLPVVPTNSATTMIARTSTNKNSVPGE